jgi:hypothetical protein
MFWTMPGSWASTALLTASWKASAAVACNDVCIWLRDAVSFSDGVLYDVPGGHGGDVATSVGEPGSYCGRLRGGDAECEGFVTALRMSNGRRGDEAKR